MNMYSSVKAVEKFILSFINFISMANILVCDDDAATMHTLQEAFISAGHSITVVNDIVDAVRIVYPARFRVVFVGVDLQKPQVAAGRIAGLRMIRESDPKLRLIVLGRSESLELERQFRSEGIFCYCLKPIEATEATEILMNALEVSNAILAQTA